MAYNGQTLAGGHVQGEILQDGRAGMVMKRDMAKLDLPAHVSQGHWMRLFGHLNLRIQDLNKVLAGRHGHLQVVLTETQVTDGFKKTLDVQHKGYQAASAEVTCQHHGTTTDD